LVRDVASAVIGFGPIERNTKVGATSATGLAGIVYFTHGSKQNKAGRGNDKAGYRAKLI
jgi:hypothetical protein